MYLGDEPIDLHGLDLPQAVGAVHGPVGIGAKEGGAVVLVVGQGGWVLFGFESSIV